MNHLLHAPVPEPLEPLPWALCRRRLSLPTVPSSLQGQQFVPTWSLWLSFKATLQVPRMLEFPTQVAPSPLPGPARASSGACPPQESALLDPRSICGERAGLLRCTRSWGEEQGADVSPLRPLPLNGKGRPAYPGVIPAPLLTMLTVWFVTLTPSSMGSQTHRNINTCGRGFLPLSQ